MVSKSLAKAKLSVFWGFLMMLLLLASANSSFAQKPTNSPYNLYFEFGGPAGIGSINLERHLWGRPSWQLKGHLGFFILPNGSLTKGDNSYFYPFGVTMLWGNDHQLEFGAGGVITLNNDGFLEGTAQNQQWGIYGHGFFGYRWQPGKAGWFLRGGYVPLYHPSMESASAPPIGSITGKWAHWVSFGIGINI